MARAGADATGLGEVFMPFPQKLFPMLLDDSLKFGQLMGLHPIIIREINRL
jgi:hypothetical protein